MIRVFEWVRVRASVMKFKRSIVRSTPSLKRESMEVRGI